MDSSVQLLLYDYQMVGQTLGTHTAIVAFEHEYWFSLGSNNFFIGAIVNNDHLLVQLLT